jgi:hypothetical protein
MSIEEQLYFVKLMCPKCKGLLIKTKSFTYDILLSRWARMMIEAPKIIAQCKRGCRVDARRMDTNKFIFIVRI